MTSTSSKKTRSEQLSNDVNLAALLPASPVSDNQLYRAHVQVLPPKKGAKGKKAKLRFRAYVALTDEGKAYKQKALDQLREQWATKPQPNPNGLYVLVISVSRQLSKIFTKGWPKRAKSPVVKWDVPNIAKIVCDIVKVATGVDDSCIFRAPVEKIPVPDGAPEFVMVRLHTMLEEDVLRWPGLASARPELRQWILESCHRRSSTSC